MGEYGIKLKKILKRNLKICYILDNSTQYPN